MLQEIAIDTNKLGNDTEQLKMVLAQLKTEQSKMIQEIQELNRMWKGKANQQFTEQFRLDCQSFENLCHAIDEMIQALENAKMEYEQCDNKVNGLICAIKI